MLPQGGLCRRKHRGVKGYRRAGQDQQDRRERLRFSASELASRTNAGTETVRATAASDDSAGVVALYWRLVTWAIETAFSYQLTRVGLRVGVDAGHDVRKRVSAGGTADRSGTARPSEALLTRPSPRFVPTVGCRDDRSRRRRWARRV